jgi:phosphate:Na+ symporter
MNTFLGICNLLGGLALFLFGMKIMSDGLQKVAGSRLRTLLQLATRNSFSATICGALVTGIIQSSSATSVMVVGFASAGLLTLNQSLGVIFGANIGTTLTAWIVSLFGFNVQISLFALPVIAIGFFIQFIPRWLVLRRLGETLVGFGLLFLGLAIMKDAIPADLATHPQVSAWLARFSPDTLFHLLVLIFSGTILTIVLQSSSAMMALTLTCAAMGIISYPTACALVLGENIGTTITANLAALGASPTARRAALGHTLFNTIGVLWAIVFFRPFIQLTDLLAPGNPYSGSLAQVLPYHIAMFHTLFNVLNTLLLLPFLSYIAHITKLIIPVSKRENSALTNLVYLETRFAQTPELALVAAYKESERMMGFISQQTGKLLRAVKTKDTALFTRLIADAKHAEQTTDVLEHKISTYLTAMAHGNLSRHAVAKAVALLDVVNNIERMGDCGEKIARILEKFHPKKAFSTHDYNDFSQIAALTKTIVAQTRQILIAQIPLDVKQNPQAHALLANALKNEQKLNTLRKDLLRANKAHLLKHRPSSPDSITAYSDVLNNFEKMGDYALRVSETILGVRSEDKIHIIK